MRGRARRAGGVFSAVGFLVLGAVTTLLLTSTGPFGDDGRDGAPGAVEIGFAQDMIVHHQQAVAMSQSVRGRVSASLSQLAAGIELNQVRELGQLQGWLALWDAPQVASGPPMTWMTDHPHPSGDTVMPGLASVDEMNHLGDLKGRDLETSFLQLMIRHHQGGLLMARAAARRTTDPHVRALATTMATEQQQETATMTGLLSAMGRRTLPPPA